MRTKSLTNSVRVVLLNATFNNIFAVSFMCEGYWSTQRKPPTCRKSLTNCTTYCCIEYTLAERNSNSQL